MSYTVKLISKPRPTVDSSTDDLLDLAAEFAIGGRVLLVSFDTEGEAYQFLNKATHSRRAPRYHGLHVGRRHSLDCDVYLWNEKMEEL